MDLRQSFAFEAPEQILFGEGVAAQVRQHRMLSLPYALSCRVWRMSNSACGSFNLSSDSCHYDHCGHMQIGTLITKLQAHRPLVITGKNGKNRYTICTFFLWLFV